MTVIETPNADKEFLTPFGPMIGYAKLPEAVISAFNSSMSDALPDHSDHLVGKVTQELLFDKPLVDLALRHLGPHLIEYHIRSLRRGSFDAYDHTTKDYELAIASGWFIRQFANEYNPLHIHSGCTLSCVGYLQLPNGIEGEWEKDYQDHHPSHGHLQFAYGVDTHYSVSNFMVKPRVGDFWIFPSYMFHCVYPFKTDGERRSFSINASITEQNAASAPGQ